MRYEERTGWWGAAGPPRTAPFLRPLRRGSAAGTLRPLPAPLLRLLEPRCKYVCIGTRRALGAGRQVCQQPQSLGSYLLAQRLQTPLLRRRESARGSPCRVGSARPEQQIPVPLLPTVCKDKPQPSPPAPAKLPALLRSHRGQLPPLRRALPNKFPGEEVRPVLPQSWTGVF